MALVVALVAPVQVGVAAADGEGAGVVAQAPNSVFTAAPVLSPDWRGVDSVSAGLDYGACAGTSCAQASIVAWCRATPLTAAEVASLTPTSHIVDGVHEHIVWQTPGSGPTTVTASSGPLCVPGTRIVAVRLHAHTGQTPLQYTHWVTGGFTPALHAWFTAGPVVSGDRRYVSSVSAAMHYDEYWNSSAAQTAVVAYCRATRLSSAEVALLTATGNGGVSGWSSYILWQKPGYGPGTVTLALDGSEGKCAAGTQVVAVQLSVNNPTPDKNAWWAPGHPVLPAEQTWGPGGCGNSAGAAAPVARRADPVNTALGVVVESATDFALPSVGVQCAFTRAYTSADTLDGPLGVGWTHPFNAALLIAPNGDVTFRSEDGQRAAFTKGSDGVFSPAAGVRSQVAAVTDGYLLTTPQQATVSFNAAGQMTAKRDRLGHGLSFSYTGGRLSEIVDSAGRRIALSYSDGMIDRVTLPDGRYVGYGYTDGRLTSVRDLRGQTSTYRYDAGGRLESQTDPLGHRKFLNTYDAATGRITEQIDALGNRSTFSWDVQTQTARMTDPRGGVWTDQYDGYVLVGETDPLGNTSSYTYDAQFDRVTATDPRGNRTTMAYDARGNLASQSAPAPLPHVERFTYNDDNALLTKTDGRGTLALSNSYDPATGLVASTTDAEGSTASFEYTARGQLATATDERGKVTTFSYDADGNQTSVTAPGGGKTTMAYDPAGRLTATVDPRGNQAGAAPADFTTAYKYDNGNLLTSVTDARGHTTTYGYDAAGRRTTATDAAAKTTTFGYDAINRPTTVTDPRGATATTAYDETGNVLSVTTPAGKTTYTYDLAGWMTKRVDPRGNAAGADPAPYTWTYSYDRNGNLSTISHPTAGTTTTHYDELDRPVRVADPLGRVTTTGYDPNSNVTFVAEPTRRTSYGYDKNNRLTQHTDPKGKITRYAYDAAGNRTSVTTPTGARTTWTFDDANRPATVVDPRGNEPGATPTEFTTTFGYDPAGQRTTVTDPLGNVTRSVFDAAGNLTRRADANGHAVNYTYDPVNRLASVRAADGAVTGYDYDAVGNLTSRTDPKSHTTSYGYDDAHQLTSLRSPLGGRWTFDYDAAGNRTRTVTAAGNATPADGDGTISATYDPLGRQTTIDYSGGTPDVTFGYDQLRRTSMTDGAGTETYGYNPADELTAVTRGSSGFAYSYDANGQVTKRTYPDGTAAAYGYDDDGRMTSVTSGGAAAAYAYDAAGNLTSTTLPATNGHVERRSYDPAGRLAKVATTAGESVLSQFAVDRDPAGNPLTVTATRGATVTAEAYAYDPADRLTKVCYAAS